MTSPTKYLQMETTLYGGQLEGAEDYGETGDPTTLVSKSSVYCKYSHEKIVLSHTRMRSDINGLIDV